MVKKKLFLKKDMVKKEVTKAPGKLQLPVQIKRPLESYMEKRGTNKGEIFFMVCSEKSMSNS